MFSEYKALSLPSFIILRKLYGTFSQIPACWSFVFVSIIPLFPFVSKLDTRQVCIYKCKFHSWAKVLFVNIYSWLHSGSKCNVTQEGILLPANKSDSFLPLQFSSNGIVKYLGSLRNKGMHEWFFFIFRGLLISLNYARIQTNPVIYVSWCY